MLCYASEAVLGRMILHQTNTLRAATLSALNIHFDTALNHPTYSEKRHIPKP